MEVACRSELHESVACECVLPTGMHGKPSNSVESDRGGEQMCEPTKWETKADRYPRALSVAGAQ